MKKAIFLLILFSFQGSLFSQSSNCYDDLLPQRYLKNGKMGFVDLFGNWKIRPKYFEVFPFDNRFARVRYGNHYGMVNCSGEEVVPPEYDELSFFSYGRIWAQKGKEWYLRDSSGNLLTESPFDEYIRSSIWHSYTWVRKNEIWQILDEGSGNFICDKEFTTVKILSDTLSLVSNRGYFAIINHKTCKFKIPEKIVSAQKVSGEHIKLRYKNRDFDVINLKGESVLKRPYREILSAGKGLARVKSNGKWGLIRSNGQEVLDLKYDSIRTFSYNRIAVKSEGQGWQYLDQKLQPLNGNYYELTSDFFEKGAFIRQSGSWKYIDIGGKVISSDLDSVFYKEGLVFGKKDSFWQLLPLTEDDEKFEALLFADPKSEMRARKGDFWGIYDFTAMKWNIAPSYSRLRKVSSEIYIAGSNGNFGIIDNTGKILTPAQYNELRWEPGFRTQIFIGKDQNYKLINKGGKVLIESPFPIYRQKSLFTGRVEKQLRLYQPDGDVIFEDKVDSIFVLPGSKTFLFQKKGKWGMSDIKGNEILDDDYSEFLILNDSYLALNKNDLWIILNMQGKILIGEDMLVKNILESFDDSFLVNTEGTKLWIDQKARIRVKDISEYFILEPGPVLIKQNTKWSLKNRDGSDFSDVKFDSYEIKSGSVVLRSAQDNYTIKNGKLVSYLPFE